MIYATLDTNGFGTISERAHIAAFATREEAEAYLRGSLSLDEGETLSIETGIYGDCWIKTFDRPGAGATIFAPFADDDVSVEAPGQHPGGHAYWLTPYPEVLVPVIERVDG